METKSVLKACIKAQASPVGLRGMAGRIPNQGMLINILPMLEAQVDPATKEALRYRSALHKGCRPFGAHGDHALPI